MGVEHRVGGLAHVCGETGVGHRRGHPPTAGVELERLGQRDREPLLVERAQRRLRDHHRVDTEPFQRDGGVGVEVLGDPQRADRLAELVREDVAAPLDLVGEEVVQPLVHERGRRDPHVWGREERAARERFAEVGEQGFVADVGALGERVDELGRRRRGEWQGRVVEQRGHLDAEAGAARVVERGGAVGAERGAAVEGEHERERQRRGLVARVRQPHEVRHQPVDRRAPVVHEHQLDGVHAGGDPQPARVRAGAAHGHADEQGAAGVDRQLGEVLRGREQRPAQAFARHAPGELGAGAHPVVDDRAEPGVGRRAGRPQADVELALGLDEGGLLDQLEDAGVRLPGGRGVAGSPAATSAATASSTPASLT